MGYRVKLQKVERPTNKSYYLNFPAAIAEALGAEKGEEFEWEIEDKNTLVLRRVAPLPPRKSGPGPGSPGSPEAKALRIPPPFRPRG